MQIYMVLPWFNEQKITINAAKKKAILFSHQHYKDVEKIEFCNIPIQWSNTVKYLGVHIDRNIKFSGHVKETARKANVAKFTLYPLLNHKSPLILSTKLCIYKSYIRPIKTYADTWVRQQLEKTRKNSIQNTQVDHRQPMVRNLRNYPQHNKTYFNKEYYYKGLIADIATKNNPKERFISRPLNI